MTRMSGADDLGSRAVGDIKAKNRFLLMLTVWLVLSSVLRVGLDVIPIRIQKKHTIETKEAGV